MAFTKISSRTQFTNSIINTICSCEAAEVRRREENSPENLCSNRRANNLQLRYTRRFHAQTSHIAFIYSVIVHHHVIHAAGSDPGDTLSTGTVSPWQPGASWEIIFVALLIVFEKRRRPSGSRPLRRRLPGAFGMRAAAPESCGTETLERNSQIVTEELLWSLTDVRLRSPVLQRRIWTLPVLLLRI